MQFPAHHSVLLTGASVGIGREMALQLADPGGPATRLALAPESRGEGASFRVICWAIEDV